MHGLINRAIQCFVRDVYGAGCWAALAEAVGVGTDGFEPMLTYEDRYTLAMIEALAGMRGQPAADILEDLGTYLVTHHNTRAVRRLLRFGGEDFTDFLHSLDDLPDRARLAVPELTLPRLALVEAEPGRYDLCVNFPHAGFGAVFTGILRALADDYGTLALLSCRPCAEGCESIGIELLDASFAEGRSFTLGGGMSPHGEIRE